MKMKWSIIIVVILLAVVALVEVFGGSSFLGATGTSSGLRVVPPQCADLGYEVYDITLKDKGDPSATSGVACTLYNNGFSVPLFAYVTATSNGTTFPVTTSLPVVIFPEPGVGVDIFIDAKDKPVGDYIVTYFVSATDETAQHLGVYISFTGKVTVEDPPPPPLPPSE